MSTFIFSLFSLNYVAITVIRQVMNCLQTLYVDIWLSVAQFLYKIMLWDERISVMFFHFLLFIVMLVTMNSHMNVPEIIEP